MKRKKPENLFLSVLLPILAGLFGLAVILYFTLGPSAGYMTSDCADSLRWAEATYRSGRLISDNFKYAALLPFGGNLIFLPFVALWGFSMKAQICGLVVFILLFAAALYYLARGMEYGRLVSAGFVSIVMLTLSASTKLREVMWEHIFYYNLGLLFFCFGFGLALRILRDTEKAELTRRETVRFWVRMAVLCVFSLIAATDGLQTLICYTMPLIAGLFAERVFSREESLRTKTTKNTLILIGTVLLCSAIGFMLIKPISGGVNAGYADGYSAYSAMDSWKDNFLKLFHNWLTLFGVSVKDGDTLVSMVSVRMVIRIFMSYLILFFPLLQLFRLNRIRRRALRIVLLANAAVLLFIVFAVTFGRLGGANWRLTPLLGTSLFSTYFTAADLIGEKGGQLRKGAILLAALIITALIPAGEILKMPADYGRDQVLPVTAGILEEHGLKRGYASFWWAGILSMHSEGKLEVAHVNLDKEIPKEYYYQQAYDVYKDRGSESFFLLLSEKEHKEMAGWLEEQRVHGRISEEFTIGVSYNFYGGAGKTVYIYVFPQNIF